MSVGPDLGRCLAYINCQTAAPSPHERHKPCVMARTSVTISRQAGCGAMSIAGKLADFLQVRDPAPCGWTVFDRNLVEKVLEEHHMPVDMARFMPEDRVSAIDDVMEEVLGLHPSSLTLLRKTTETILHLATLGNVILVGRGSAVATRSLPNVFHVRLVTPLEQRIEKVMTHNHLAREEALAFIKKEDLGRRRYLKDHFNADIDDCMLYDLMVNTARISHEKAAQTIGEAVLSWKQSLSADGRDA